MPKLAIISTHPIQYYAPLFRILNDRNRIDVKVFFEWKGASEKGMHDQGFGQEVEWDIPLLDGYNYTFIPNRSNDPGTHHFRGLVNPSLIADVEGWNPDAILIFGWNFWSHLKVLWHFKGEVPLFFRGDSTLLDEQGGIRTMARRLFLRWVYHYIDIAFYVGEKNKAYFKKHGLSEGQLVWAPHAIENKRFQGNGADYQHKAKKWRNKLAIPEKHKVILFAGKLGPKKNPKLLLQAFQKMESDNLHLVYAGSGELERDLKQLASGNDRVHFIGFQNQSKMPVVYRLGDLLVLPSKGPGETWGLAVNEAMASGTPALVSDKVGCAPDMIEVGKTGFIFESGNTNDLKAKLKKGLKLKEKPETKQALAEKTDDYSLYHLANTIEETAINYLS